MRIFIGGRSAVQYWVRESLAGPYGLLTGEPLRRRLGTWGYHVARIKTLEQTAPSDAAVRDHLRGALCGLSCPLDVLVSTARARSDTPVKVCHVWSKPIPTGAFVRVADDLYIAAPEFAFRQLVRGLSDCSTVKLAYEFCASYVRSSEDARGFRACSPLTSVSLLRSSLTVGQRQRGLERLTGLLRYVRDGSASPAETLSTAPLLLSCAHGGFGIAGGEMNGRLELPSEPFDGRTFRYACDLLWRSEKVAVEYDSDMYHTGPDRIAHDSERKNRLLDAGYSVITVTKRQLFDPWAFEVVARQIAKALGKRSDTRKRQYDWRARYLALRRDLFDGADLWDTGV